MGSIAILSSDFPQGKAGGAGSVKHHQLQELIPVKTSESKPFSIPKPAPFNIRNPQDHRIQNGFVNNKKNKPHTNSKFPINIEGAASERLPIKESLPNGL